MDLSIIIPSYNTVKETCDCLESVYKSLAFSNQSLTYEVIVFDNNSSDITVPTIQKKFPNVILIKNKENLGYGKGNNAAVKRTHGDMLFFLNSDILVLDNAITKLYEFFSGNSQGFTIVGARLRNRDMSLQPSAAPFFSLPVICAALFLKGDYCGLTRYSPGKVTSVDWVSGACFMMRKKDFQTLHGFDEHIFMYMDEVDFMYRAHQKGMTVGFYPFAEFIHYGAFSTNKGTDVKPAGIMFDGKKKPVAILFNGFLYFYRKHKSNTEQHMLKLMLFGKALLGIAAGFVIGSEYLKQTYGEAYKLVKKG
jgi:GT2 family glycosyltransferase